MAELATPPTEPRDAELAVFQSFAVSLAASVARPWSGGAEWWQAALPAIAIAAHFALVARSYEGVSLVAAGLAWATPSPLVAVIAYSYLQMRVLRERSNALRVAALTALFFACFASSHASAALLCVVGVELSSWSTERYMLPWRLDAAPGSCGGYGARFFLGFVVGVHVLDAAQEPRVLWRPPSSKWLAWSVRGVAVHGDVAFLRYRAAPLGVLLAYVEGLGVLASRIEVERADRDDPDSRVTALRVILWGGLHLLRVECSDWIEGKNRGPRGASATTTTVVVSASRFPLRRLLLGLMLRLEWT